MKPIDVRGRHERWENETIAVGSPRWSGFDVTHKGLRIAYWVNILLYALVMGVFWGTWFSLSRSIASIKPEVFLDIGHTMIANLAGPMRLLMPASLISSVVLLILLARRRRDAVFYLTVASFVLMIGALVITLVVNVPIDNDIARWTPNTLPADWTAIRDRWELFHALRTTASVAALGCVVASALSWVTSSQVRTNASVGGHGHA
jgi:uncharacterized membrane protein